MKRRGPGSKRVASANQLDLFAAAEEAAADGTGFTVDLEAFEGPLHVLLALARTEKLDLLEIAIDELVDQYLIFMDAARQVKLELAADYVVMAAWLALLKSRLLLPKPETPEDDTPPEELARRLAFRLRRLEAMRVAAQRLEEQDRDGLEVHGRGAPEPSVRMVREWDASLFDLLKAYGRRRSQTAQARVRIPRPNVYALDDARRRLDQELAAAKDWRSLDDLAPGEAAFSGSPPPKASRRASAFAAALELARDGRADMRQDGAFRPLYLRGRKRLETVS